GEIERVGNLAQVYVLPSRAFRCPRPITHLIAAHDHRSCVRSAGKNFRERPHEDVISAIWLQIAIDKTNNLSAHTAFTCPSEPNDRIGIWLYGICINAIMNDAGHIARELGKLPPLPLGRANAPVRSLDREKKTSVAGAKFPKCSGIDDREIRVKIKICVLS